MLDIRVSDRDSSEESLQLTDQEIPAKITQAIARTETSEDSPQSLIVTAKVCAVCHEMIHEKNLDEKKFWSHNPGSIHDFERHAEHEWHKAIKAFFPEKQQEFYIPDELRYRRYRRPDAYTSHGLAIEGQYSYISGKRIEPRSRFLQEHGGVIWIVHLHFHDCFGFLFERTIVEPSRDEATFPEAKILAWPRRRFFDKWVRAKILTEGIFFDAGTGVLWQLTGGESSVECEFNGRSIQGVSPAKLTPIRRDYLLKGLGEGRRLEDAVREGHELQNLEPLSDLSWMPFGPFDSPDRQRASFESLTWLHQGMHELAIYKKPWEVLDEGPFSNKAGIRLWPDKHRAKPEQSTETSEGLGGPA